MAFQDVLVRLVTSKAHVLLDLRRRAGEPHDVDAALDLALHELGRVIAFLPLRPVVRQQARAQLEAAEPRGDVLA